MARLPIDRPGFHRGCLCMLALAAFSAGAGELPSTVITPVDHVPLSHPAINPGGDIAYRGEVTGLGEGIYVKSRSPEGPPVAATSEGQEPSAPFSDPNLRNGIGSARAPSAFFQRVTTTADDVLWVERSDGTSLSVVPIARRGEPAPGTGKAFLDVASLGPPVINAAGQVVLTARVDDVTGRQSGLWIDTNRQADGNPALALLARSGDKIDTESDIETRSFDRFLDASAVLNDQGRVAFSAMFSNDGNGGGGLRRGIWISDNGATKVPVELEDEPFENLSSRVSINAAGQVAYLRNGSIWVHGRGEVFNPQNARMAVRGEQFLLRNDGEVVFIGTQLPDPGSTESVLGIFVTVGNAAPGRPVVTQKIVAQKIDAGESYYFHDFFDLNANRQDQLSFRAQLRRGAAIASATPVRDGLFFVTAGNTVHRVALGPDLLDSANVPGDEFDLPERAAQRIVNLRPNPGWQDLSSSNGADGLRSSLSESGRLAWSARFPSGYVHLVTETPVEIPPTLVGLEVVQVVQDWRNTIPLIEGKETLVRAHVVATTVASLSPVALTGHRTGGEAVAIAAANTGRALELTSDAAKQRGNLEHSLYYEIPPDLTSGEVTFSLPGTALKCAEAAGPAPDDCAVTVVFEPAPQPALHLVGVDYERNGKTYTADREFLLGAAARMLAQFPVADFKLKTTTGYREFASRPKVPKMVNLAKALRASDGCGADCEDIYLLIAQGSGDGKRAGRGKSDLRAGAAYVPASVGGKSRTTITHETSHILDRPHATDPAKIGTRERDGLQQAKGACGSISDPGSEVFPNFFPVKPPKSPPKYEDKTLPLPTLGPMDQGDDELIYGFDWLLRDIADPDRHFELMSYCRSGNIERFASDVTYLALRDEIQGRFGEKAKGNGPRSDYLLIAGTVTIASGAVELQPAQRVNDMPEPAVSESGEWQVEFIDAGGALLATRSFAVEASAPSLLYDESLTDEDTFLVAVDASLPVAQVRVVSAGEVKSTLTASANAPGVSITEPLAGALLDQTEATVAWAGNDPDGDGLTYSLDYSPDGGLTWRGLAAGLAVSSVNVPRENLVASAQTLFRVTASDGLLFASDATAAVTVVNTPPAVLIRDPDHGRLFSGSQVIVLSALTVDSEDTASQVTVDWSSDLSGPLGSGPETSVLANELAEGEHVITATAIDSQGRMDTANTVITVVRQAPEQVADLRVAVLPELHAPVSAAGRLLITVTNHGPSAVQNPRIDLSISELPPGNAGVLSIGTNWACNLLGAVADCSTAVLAPGEVEELWVDISGNPRIATIMLNAQVSSTTVDPHLFNNVAVAEAFVSRRLYSDGFEQ